MKFIKLFQLLACLRDRRGGDETLHSIPARILSQASFQKTAANPGKAFKNLYEVVRKKLLSCKTTYNAQMREGEK